MPALGEFSKLEKLFEDELLRREGPFKPGERCRDCLQGSAVSRCTECFGRQGFCDACIAQAHKALPFHRIQKWNGLFFERVTLTKLGAILAFCQCCGSNCNRRKITVVHTNGLHEVEIGLCAGASASPHFIQLLQHDMFPATIKSPVTAVTFDCLRDFHQHSLCSKKSAYDYVTKLARSTDNVVPM
ncbi:hypothetical protein DACRYDRAFT_23059, partial [Dacryopinax primogenitus]